MPLTLKPYVKKPPLVVLGGRDSGSRIGKGFSLGELKEAGLDVNTAIRLGIPVDKRRKTSWNHNVKILKDLLNILKYSK